MHDRKRKFWNHRTLDPAIEQAIYELQGGKCPICLGPATCLDGSYRNGAVRGYLCRQCNTALGMLKDSPTRLRRALKYLEQPPAKQLLAQQAKPVADAA